MMNFNNNGWLGVKYLALLLIGLSLLLIVEIGTAATVPLVLPQTDEAPQAPPARPKKAKKAKETSAGAGTRAATAPVTYENKFRPFSYSIPPGWTLVKGDPTGYAADFGSGGIEFKKDGSRCYFSISWNQYPQCSRKELMEQKFEKAVKEKNSGHHMAVKDRDVEEYLAVKRRNQGGEEGIIGCETIAIDWTGTFCIKWECTDGENYFYRFSTRCYEKNCNAHRAEMQRIIDSIRFK